MLISSTFVAVSLDSRTLAVRGRLYDAARSRKCSVGRKRNNVLRMGDMSVDGKTAAPRVLKLIDFLSDYDAQRHPPVHDINDERTVPPG